MTTKEELTLRKRQLAERDGQPGYRATAAALRDKIAELKGQQ